MLRSIGLSIIFFIIIPELHSLWILTILVCTWLTVTDIEIYKYKVYYWNQSQQQPPSATSCVVKTTNANSNTRNKSGQSIYNVYHWYPTQN